MTAVATSHEPSYRMLTIVIVALACSGFLSLLVVRLISASTLRQTLEAIGVAVHKVTNAAKEIERKTFHICGLMVPLVHMTLLDNDFSHSFCSGLCWAITIFGWTFEVSGARRIGDAYDYGCVSALPTQYSWCATTSKRKFHGSNPPREGRAATCVVCV